MRVATWNLERADAFQSVGAVQARQIASAAADVWLFSEVRSASVPAGLAVATSSPMLTPEPAFFAAIAAPSIQPLEVPEVPTAAAALVDHAGVHWLVLAVCMPWRVGAPALPPDAAAVATTGPQQWQAVLDHLDGAVTRLRAEHAGLPVVLGGDLNQGLSGWLTGGRRGRDRLLTFLAHHGLTAYTADHPSVHEGAGTIDHVCGSAPHRASGWFRPDLVPGRAKAASDHGGYWVDIEPSP